MEGDFKDICLFIIHKISPCPSFPKRGVMGLDQKAIYKQTLNRSPIKNSISSNKMKKRERRGEK
jgi:hypothetical protein